MINEKDMIKLPHKVIMEDRKSVFVTGVSDVDSFDENVIVAVTDMGELTMKGVDLHINSLNIDKGELSVSGSEIQSLIYTNDAPGGRQGFFSRVFR